jgi:hypothetical protein
MDWKAPPADPEKMWLNKSLEIQLLLACNWSCVACDQHSQFTQIAFIKRGTMTLAQVQNFIAEMREHNAYFGRLRLVGGEPSIHPKFAEMVQLLQAELVDAGHVGRLEVVTNGSKPEKIDPVRKLLRVRTSDDGDKQKHHTANLIHTPFTLGYEGKPCSAPWHCGISLNYYGYFPCSSGAGIARLQDWMRWQRLTLPLSRDRPCNAVRENWPDLGDLCGHCYHALKPEHKVKCGTSDPEKNLPGPGIKEHLDPWLAGKQPTWAVYGQAEPAAV